MLEVEATMNFFVPVARHNSSIFSDPIMLLFTYTHGSLTLACPCPGGQVDHARKALILEVIDDRFL